MTIASATAINKTGKACKFCPVNETTKPTAVSGAFIVMAKKTHDPINMAEFIEISGKTN